MKYFKVTNYIKVGADGLNYTPYYFKEVKKKDGSTDWEWSSSNKYFPTMDSCIKYLIHKILVDGEVEYFVEYLSEYKKVLEDIKDTFGEV